MLAVGPAPPSPARVDPLPLSFPSPTARGARRFWIVGIVHVASRCRRWTTHVATPGPRLSVSDFVPTEIKSESSFSSLQCTILTISTWISKTTITPKSLPECPLYLFYFYFFNIAHSPPWKSHGIWTPKIFCNQANALIIRWHECFTIKGTILDSHCQSNIHWKKFSCDCEKAILSISKIYEWHFPHSMIKIHWCGVCNY